MRVAEESKALGSLHRLPERSGTDHTPAEKNSAKQAHALVASAPLTTGKASFASVISKLFDSQECREGEIERCGKGQKEMNKQKDREVKETSLGLYNLDAPQK